MKNSKDHQSLASHPFGYVKAATFHPKSYHNTPYKGYSPKESLCKSHTNFYKISVKIIP